MSEVRVEINKDDLREISRMPTNLRDETEAMLAKVLDLAVREVKASFPRRSGKSAESFSGSLSRKGAGLEAAVESDWFVARLQEYGYEGHWHILPSGAKAWIPPKPRREDGYHAEPAILRVIESLGREWDEVVERL